MSENRYDFICGPLFYFKMLGNESGDKIKFARTINMHNTEIHLKISRIIFLMDRMFLIKCLKSFYMTR